MCPPARGKKFFIYVFGGFRKPPKTWPSPDSSRRHRLSIVYFPKEFFVYVFARENLSFSRFLPATNHHVSRFTLILRKNGKGPNLFHY
jgi:hypothetical protein